MQHLSLPQQLLNTLPDFLMITGLASFLLVLFFSLVRWRRLPEWWVIGGIGALLLLFSLSRIIPAIVKQPTQQPENLALASSMLGLAAVVSALYALAQWPVRGGFLFVKQARSWFSRQVRALLLFLRAHHRFFGWSVLAIVTLHAVFYVPRFVRMPLGEALTQVTVLTGSLAWLILAGLVGLGLLIERAIKRKRLPTQLRWLHTITALLFLILTLAHIGIR